MLIPATQSWWTSGRANASSLARSTRSAAFADPQHDIAAKNNQIVRCRRFILCEGHCTEDPWVRSIGPSGRPVDRSHESQLRGRKLNGRASRNAGERYLDSKTNALVSSGHD